jgi:phage shock protein PspC (stress-responsive transcriptional regulator)
MDELQPQQPKPVEPRKLYRSQTNRQVAGVAGGLAEYLNVDPTLIRVLFIALAVAGGAGLVMYVAMWIIVPEAEEEPPATGESSVGPS